MRQQHKAVALVSAGMFLVCYVMVQGLTIVVPLRARADYVTARQPRPRAPRAQFVPASTPLDSLEQPAPRPRAWRGLRLHFRARFCFWGSADSLPYTCTRQAWQWYAQLFGMAYLALNFFWNYGRSLPQSR